MLGCNINISTRYPYVKRWHIKSYDSPIIVNTNCIIRVPLLAIWRELYLYWAVARSYYVAYHSINISYANHSALYGRRTTNIYVYNAFCTYSGFSTVL